MPAKWFLCPDGQKTEIGECLNNGCRMGERCMTLPTLTMIGEQRAWTGKPSTTQCINGTRLEFLKLTFDYTIDPQDRAFMVLGTKAHLALEDVQVGETLNEERFTDGEDVTGIADHYDGDECCLWDYKTSGSYKVAKALGLVAKKVPDPSGAVYQRNGKGYQKGDPKQITVFEVDPEAVDYEDWALQQNRYRLFLEEAGFEVKKIKIEACVRDGNTYVAKGRGVDRNIYVIPLPIMDDDYVREYFNRKSAALVNAMKDGTRPDFCTEQERWGNMRCERFCEVSHLCYPPWLEEDKPQAA